MHFVTFLGFCILQVLAVIHAVKRGYDKRYVLAICMCPIAGPVVHFVLDILPRAIEDFKRTGFFSTLQNKKVPLKEQLVSLREKAMKEPNYENAYNLILCLLSLDHSSEAIFHIEKLQKGIYKDCQHLNMLKAQAELQLGHKESAFKTIKEVIACDSNQCSETSLLFAKILEANHHDYAALDEYKKILDRCYSFEAHYNYIRMLKRLNRLSEIQDEVVSLINRYQGLTKYHKRLNRKWVVLTHQIH